MNERHPQNERMDSTRRRRGPSMAEEAGTSAARTGAALEPASASSTEANPQVRKTHEHNFIIGKMYLGADLDSRDVEWWS